MAASRPAANEMNETAKLYRSRSDLIRMNEGSDVRRDGDTVSRGDDHLPMSTMIDTREPPAYTPDRHDRRLPSRRFGDTSSSSTRRIVVAADGSPSSTQGLRQVADFAPRLGATVVVVYVRQLPSPTFLYPGIDQGLVDALEEQEADVRQEALRLVGLTGVAWKFVIRVGSPGEEITRVAEEIDADLVVLGGNRHGSIHNLLLGSTAAYLATHSPVPVLIMRSKIPAPIEPLR